MGNVAEIGLNSGKIMTTMLAMNERLGFPAEFFLGSMCHP